MTEDVFSFWNVTGERRPCVILPRVDRRPCLMRRGKVAAAWNFWRRAKQKMKKQVVLGPESSSSLHKLESHRHTFPRTSSFAPERGSAEQTSGGHSLQFYRICLRPERLSPAQLAFAVSWLSAGERRESAALRWINLSDTLFFLSRICGNGLVFSSTCTGEMTLQRERERERERGKKRGKKEAESRQWKRYTEQ